MSKPLPQLKPRLTFFLDEDGRTISDNTGKKYGDAKTAKAAGWQPGKEKVKPRKIPTSDGYMIARPPQPIVDPTKDWEMYRDALKLRGVNMANEPKKREMYKWTNEALDKIEYEDIGKLILIALKKIRKQS